MEFEDHLYTKVLNFVKLENDSAVIRELEAIARTDVPMKIRALNRVLMIRPLNASANFKTANLSLIRRYNPDMTDLIQLKSVKDLYNKGLGQVRIQAILKAMSEKRGLGTDISKNLTE
ncbi:uncharacterized protein LOC136026546 [Artemia franciscana]|uniref:uncharacterized protein LOC136026546 n=1 Tax=Artemia franciscana TaxID=6661 RepID=UPI0032DADACA